MIGEYIKYQTMDNTFIHLFIYRNTLETLSWQGGGAVDSSLVGYRGQR